jgi:hypothetical protein
MHQLRLLEVHNARMRAVLYMCCCWYDVTRSSPRLRDTNHNFRTQPACVVPAGFRGTALQLKQRVSTRGSDYSYPVAALPNTISVHQKVSSRAVRIVVSFVKPKEPV